jgi:peptide/nickel transport system permease protein
MPVVAQLGFLASRLGKGLLVLAGVIVLNFVVLRLAPGDPAMVIAGDQGAADAAFVEEIRRDLGLDRSVPEQLVNYAAALVRFDFGQSYREKRPVFAIVAERLPATILLTFSALACSLLAGILMGSGAARRAGSAIDAILTGMAITLFAMPLFWTGLVAILIFSVWLDWLPSYGMVEATTRPWGLGYALDVGRHLLLPMATLAAFYAAIYTRVTRSAVLEVLDRDFVRTARAKGVSAGSIWRRHVLRNALLPIITFASLQAGHLIGGSILVETVFAWPGIGRLAFDALLQRDYNVLLAVFFISSVIVIVVNLVADALYALADPRVRLK